MPRDVYEFRIERSSEEAVELLRRTAIAVRSGLSPEYVAVLRSLPAGERVRQAFGLWRMARDALVRQGLRRGLSVAEAHADAARRLLEQGDGPSA